MEQVNADLVDMVNQILSFQHPAVPATYLSAPTTVDDVKLIVAKSMMRLRVILEAVTPPTTPTKAD